MFSQPLKGVNKNKCCAKNFSQYNHSVQLWSKITSEAVQVSNCKLQISSAQRASISYKYFLKVLTICAELGVLVCTFNQATLEAKFWGDVGSVPVGGRSPSIGG